MNARAYSFLEGVLGKDGARAFKKAVEHEDTLTNAVVPRAILSWIDLATTYRYEGEVPGVENTYIQFKKSETDLFNGALAVGDDTYTFDNATRYHVAATVAVMLGVDALAIDDRCREITLQRLGKSIDTLVKARVAIEALKKGDVIKFPGNPKPRVDRGQDAQVVDASALRFQDTPANQQLLPGAYAREAEAKAPHGSYRILVHHAVRDGVASVHYRRGDSKTTTNIVAHALPSYEAAVAAATEHHKKQQVQKTEMPGQSNKPKEQMEPQAPQAPQFQQAQPRPPKPTGLKVTKAQADKKCSMCQRSMFKAGQFTGCLCFMDMAKSVKTTAHDGFYVLTFKSVEWDADAIEALKGALRGR